MNDLNRNFLGQRYKIKRINGLINILILFNIYLMCV